MHMVREQEKIKRRSIYLPTLDILRAGVHVHGHCHDNLQPGLYSERPPQRHGLAPRKLRLLQPLQLLLAV